MIITHESTETNTGSLPVPRPQNRKDMHKQARKEKKQKPLVPKEPKKHSLLEAISLLRPQRWNPLSRTEKDRYHSPLETPKVTASPFDEPDEPLPPEAAELLSDDLPLVDESEWTRPKEFTVMDLSDRARARNLVWKSGRNAGRDHDAILYRAWLEERQSSDEEEDDEEIEAKEKLS